MGKGNTREKSRNLFSVSREGLGNRLREVSGLAMDRQIQWHFEDQSEAMANLEATVELEDVAEESEDLAKRTLVGKNLAKKIY